jgi:DNA-binding transcriptional MocR family regulator
MHIAAVLSSGFRVAAPVGGYFLWITIDAR